MSQGALKLAHAQGRQEGLRGENEPELFSAGEVAHLQDALEQQLGAVLQRNETLEQLNSCFEAALNHMGRGLSMFDSEQRLVVCNKAYADIYALPAELARPGHAVPRYSVLPHDPRHRRAGLTRRCLGVDPGACDAASAGRAPGRDPEPRRRPDHPRDLRTARRRRLGRHAGRHHRAAAVRRKDRMAGASRHADRNPKPLPFPRAPRAPVRDI